MGVRHRVHARRVSAPRGHVHRSGGPCRGVGRGRDQNGYDHSRAERPLAPGCDLIHANDLTVGRHVDGRERWGSGCGSWSENRDDLHVYESCDRSRDRSRATKESGMSVQTVRGSVDHAKSWQTDRSFRHRGG